MSFENFKNESERSNVEASIAALEKEKRMEMSRLQDKFEKSDTEKRTKVAQEIVDLENSYNREIEALRGPKKIVEKKEVIENKELKENKKELNLEEISLFAKAEAGFLLDPKAIRDEIERLKQELKVDYETLRYDSDKRLEDAMVAKENQIRKLEIILLDTENKIKNDYGKKGPENVVLIMSQEDKILKSLKELNEDDLSLVPQARELIHKWNVADAKDYFTDEQKIKGALLITLENKKKEEIAKPQVKETVIEEKNIESQVIKETPAEKKKREDLEMFDDMQKIAYFKEPIKEVQNNQNEQAASNKKESVQEKVDKEKRAGIFEYIRRNKKLKWLLMTLGIATVGFGVFKGMEKNDDKKQDKVETRVDKAENKPDSTIVLTPEDFESEADKILKGVNPDVSETITEEVGLIRKMVVLEKGDGVGLINDYKMHNSYKVNFIDGETGAIYKNLEAISRTVQPGDLVIENTNGEIFVICFYGIHDSGKTGYEGLSNNTESSLKTDNAVEQTVPQVNIETTPDDSVAQNNVEVKTNITPKDSSNNEFISSNPDIDFENMPVIDLTKDFIQYKQGQKDSIENKIVINQDTSNVETKIAPEKTKKNFFQRLFGPKEKKVEKDTVSRGSEIVPERVVVSEPVKTDTLNIEKNIPQQDTIIKEKNVSNPVKIDISNTDNNIQQKDTVVKKNTVSNGGSEGFSQPVKLNISKEISQEDAGVSFGTSDSEDDPRSGLKSIERKLPGSEEKQTPKIGNELGINSENFSVKQDKYIGEGVGPANNPSVKENNGLNKTPLKKNFGKSKMNPDDLAKMIKENKLKGVRFFENEIKIDKNTSVVVNQVIDSLKNVGIVEKTIVQKDSVVAPVNVDKTSETQSNPGYIIEKTEPRPEPAPGQIRSTLTLKKVEGGYLVKNSNGTYSTVIIDEKLMPELKGFNGENEIVYVENSDGSWYKVMLEVGK